MRVYTLGFVFDEYKEFCLMVRKQYGPPVNFNKLNGVGGKLHLDEKPMDCMIREWSEEVGDSIVDWTEVGQMRGEGWFVYLYKSEFNVGFIPPNCNDVNEVFVLEEVASIVNPSYSYHYAQNVPTIVNHIISGQGILDIKL